VATRSPSAKTSGDRYLGVILDKNLTFAAHVNAVAKKAARTAATLARLMPNIGGPDQWKRKLLGSVVDSQLLYARATSVWSKAIADVARTRKNLIRPQRSAALRVTRSYRTVLDEACTPSADLVGLERGRIRYRLQAETEPGELRPSKAAVKREERSPLSHSGRQDGRQLRRPRGRGASFRT